MAIEIDYAKKLLKLQNKLGRQIDQFYFSAILDVTGLASTLPYKNQIFDLKLYPQLQKRVDKALAELAGNLNITIANGINQAWTLSDEKNRVFLDRRLNVGRLPAGFRKSLFDTNLGAKKAFLNRKRNGLGLSDRIQSTVESFRKELVNGLAAGIANGESAKTMAASIRKNLAQPDKAFRRVRDEDGRLRLSKAAQNYHPGQGVYRSSYKNALRITRTETNMSYRTADYERWKSQKFVVGVEIKLSAAHPKTDICDSLAGKYPKDFKWVGWHPHCICYIVPIMITDQEMDKYEDEILGIGKWDGTSENAVSDAPPGYYEYLKANKETINKAQSTAYWVQDNKKYTASLRD